MCVGFRLEAGLRLDPFPLLGWKWRTIRELSLAVSWAGGGGKLIKASGMVGCLVAMLIAWAEGLSGRVPQADAKMIRQRGAMERSSASGPEIFGFRRHQSSRLLDESRALRYLKV
jgi:hypothetical protein